VAVTVVTITTAEVDFGDVFWEASAVNVLSPFTRHSIEVFEGHAIGLGVTEIDVVTV